MVQNSSSCATAGPWRADGTARSCGHARQMLTFNDATVRTFAPRTGQTRRLGVADDFIPHHLIGMLKISAATSGPRGRRADRHELWLESRLRRRRDRPCLRQEGRRGARTGHLARAAIAGFLAGASAARRANPCHSSAAATMSIALRARHARQKAGVPSASPVRRISWCPGRRGMRHGRDRSRTLVRALGPRCSPGRSGCQSCPTPRSPCLGKNGSLPR